MSRKKFALLVLIASLIGGIIGVLMQPLAQQYLPPDIAKWGDRLFYVAEDLECKYESFAFKSAVKQGDPELCTNDLFIKALAFEVMYSGFDVLSLDIMDYVNSLNGKEEQALVLVMDISEVAYEPKWLDVLGSYMNAMSEGQQALMIVLTEPYGGKQYIIAIYERYIPDGEEYIDLGFPPGIYPLADAWDKWGDD